MGVRLHRRPVRWRVEQVGPTDFAVVSVFDSSIIEAGFTSYSEAWAWIAAHLPGERRYG
jgi:hypothetical protein